MMNKMSNAFRTFARVCSLCLALFIATGDRSVFAAIDESFERYPVHREEPARNYSDSSFMQHGFIITSCAQQNERAQSICRVGSSLLFLPIKYGVLNQPFLIRYLAKDRTEIAYLSKQTLLQDVIHRSIISYFYFKSVLRC